MSEKLKVKVCIKSEHISNGKHSPASCPIALALRETYPTCRAWVGHHFIWFNGHEYQIPYRLSKHIKYYDRTGEMDCIEEEFELDEV